MDSYDIAGALAEGIKSGLTSYQAAKANSLQEQKMRQEQERAEEERMYSRERAARQDARQAEIDKVSMFDKGIQRDEQGGLSRTQDYLDKQKAEKDMAGARLGLLKAQVDAAKNKPKYESFKYATDLRKERSGLPTSRDTQKVAASYGRVLEAAKKPSAAGDLALIFNYMKILDPGSTVREGEFANAQNSGGVDDQVVAQYNQILKGERLSPTQRADFLNQAYGQYAAQAERQKIIDEKYSQLASQGGANPEDVIIDFGRGFERPGTSQSQVDPVVARYAKENNLAPEVAESILRGRGWTPNGQQIAR